LLAENDKNLDRIEKLESDKWLLIEAGKVMRKNLSKPDDVFDGLRSTDIWGRVLVTVGGN
jgi:hypothetical protein